MNIDYRNLTDKQEEYQKQINRMNTKTDKQEEYQKQINRRNIKNR